MIDLARRANSNKPALRALFCFHFGRKQVSASLKTKNPAEWLGFFGSGRKINFIDLLMGAGTQQNLSASRICIYFSLRPQASLSLA